MSCLKMTSPRKCLNSPDSFCYICGQYTFKDQRRNMSEYIMAAYKEYFNIEVWDQDKWWAPHYSCETCVEALRKWKVGNRKGLAFGRPMIWREPRSHERDCYFCLTKTFGISKKTRHSLIYPNVASVNRPVPHTDSMPMPTCRHQDIEQEPGPESSQESFSQSSVSSFSAANKIFNQSELNDLVRDLGLSKELSEVLASRLNEKGCLERGTKITYYRKREEELLVFFTSTNDFVYCHDISGLITALGAEQYDPKDWRLFLDSSKHSMKCVLLHNGNRYGAIPIGHSTSLKETYEHIRSVLQYLKYWEHNWVICVDLKMVNFLLGQQSGYTKHPCYLCLWDSRAKERHWKQKEWPERQCLKVGQHNVVNEPLVEREKIIFPLCTSTGEIGGLCFNIEQCLDTNH